MALTDCSFAVSLTVKATGTIAAQGNAVSNAVTDPTTGASGGSTQSLSYGTTSGKADIVAVAEVDIAGAASATYDLYTGTDIKDLFGGTAAFRKIKSLVVQIMSGGDTSGVIVGAAASNEWVGFFGASGDTLTIYPSGPPFVVGSPAGVAVGSSTKNLKIANAGAASARIRISIAGTSV